MPRVLRSVADFVSVGAIRKKNCFSPLETLLLEPQVQQLWSQLFSECCHCLCRRMLVLFLLPALCLTVNCVLGCLLVHSARGRLCIVFSHYQWSVCFFKTVPFTNILDLTQIVKPLSLCSGWFKIAAAAASAYTRLASVRERHQACFSNCFI